MTYRDRRELKADRLRDWADKREAKASAASEKASEMASVIPFGQPILAGHYSEGRDRRYRDRIGRQMCQAVEHGRKAEEFERRARGIDAQLAGSIYSDDVDAVERLRERLEVLEAERARVKAFNVSCRKGRPDWSILTEAEQAHHHRTLEIAGWRCKDSAFPGYHLSNLSGNIKRNRDRLAQLERAQNPAQMCDRCGIGPFFLVPARKFPTLCLDCADVVTDTELVGARPGRDVTGRKDEQGGGAAAAAPSPRRRGCDPVGVLEIAERLGFPPQTVRMWRTRGRMPEPRWTVSGLGAWNWPDVVAWAQETGRWGRQAAGS